MKNEIFHHGLSGKEIKDPLPELGFIPRSGSGSLRACSEALISAFSPAL
ncbi:MAG: hypothetical protein ACKO3R_10725 [bacterium]